MNQKVLVIVFVLFSAFSVGAQTDAKPSPTPVEKANARPNAPEPKPEPFDKATVSEMSKCVTLDTSAGVIEVEMFPDTAPNTVRNFLNLTAIKAFDNTLFTRVVPGFVIQGGNLWSNPDITNEMKWRAARTIPDEPNLVRHERGIISMARGDEPDTARTSFFILVADSSSLDNKFAAFGRVVSGMDVVDAINKMEVEEEKPKEPVLIKTAVVKGCTETSIIDQ